MTQHFQPAVYPRVDDEATILVEYPNAQGIIQASWNWPANRKDLEVYGERGFAIATGGNGLRVALPNEPDHAVTPAPRAADEHDSIAHLIAVARGTRKPNALVVAREQPDRDRDSRSRARVSEHAQGRAARSPLAPPLVNRRPGSDPGRSVAHIPAPGSDPGRWVTHIRKDCGYDEAAGLRGGRSATSTTGTTGTTAGAAGAAAGFTPSCCSTAGTLSPSASSCCSRLKTIAGLVLAPVARGCCCRCRRCRCPDR